MKQIFLLLTLLSFKEVGYAAELFELNTSVRALGMGNAYTSLVNDSDALFYNPAGIPRVEGYNWRIIDIRAGVSGLEAFEKVQGAQDDSEFTDTVRDLYGEHVWLGAGGKSAIFTPYFAIAAYDSFDASLSVDNPAVPELVVNAVNDYGVAIGFGASILPTFQWGMVVKRITRMGSRAPYGPSFIGTLDPDNISENVESTGVGYSLDMGFNLTVDTPVNPTVSFVWKNMGVTKFEPDGDIAPPRDLDEMIIGASLVLDAGIAAVSPSIDYKHLNRSDVQIGKKINLGVEIDLPLLDLRAGFHQGYYTLGAGVSLGLIQVDAATYGVELGEYPGQLEDRRYVIQLSLELGIDPSLGFLGGIGSSSNGSRSGGGRSRLKQRR